MIRRGLFGGTFDPIHSGHMALVEAVSRALDLKEVWLMPASVPPHKLKGHMACGEDRLAMCRLAAREVPGVQVSDMELKRGGASFTADTLDALTAAYPDTRWHLFVGADMFLTIDTWHRFADIAAMAVLCTVPRDGVTAEQLQRAAARLSEMGADCRVVDMPPVDISSTDVRRRAQEGEPLTGLVPPAVEEYIAAHGLYKETLPPLPADGQILEILRGRLKNKRFLHSLAVAEEAARLAAKYGADPAKAKTAGLLHDIMKNTDPAEQLQILEKYGILLTPVERSAEKLYHAMSGAVFIEKVLGIADRDILDAVRYHTTGRAGMSLFEKVLYLADFTSADRDYDDVAVMRRLVEKSMDEAMAYALAYTIRELTEKQAPVHPDTVAAYNEIMLQRAKGAGE